MSKAKLYIPRQADTGKIEANPVYATLGLMREPGESLVSGIRRGYSVKVIDNLVEELDIKQVSLLKVLDLTSATLTRRRQGTKRLSAKESDRVYRVASAYRAAVQLFDGNREQARRWLNLPAKALSGNTPLEHLDTEAGADEVQDLITRIEHGVVA